MKSRSFTAALGLLAVWSLFLAVTVSHTKGLRSPATIHKAIMVESAIYRSPAIVK